METTSFSYKTLRNSVYLFANFFLPMAFTVFVTRAMAIKLGPGEYGIFLLLNAISSFVNFVDLGLGTAVTKYAAEYQGAGNKQGLENLLSTARLMFVLTGILGFLIFFILGKWFLPLFHVSGETQPHIFLVFMLAGVVFFINSVTTVYAAVLQALQRFDLTSKLSITFLALTSLGTVIVLQMGFQLKAVMGLNVIIGLLILWAYHHYSRKLLPELKLSLILDKIELKKAYNFGLLAFVSNFASTSLIYLDRTLIPIFLGPAQLPFYSVPGNVAIKTSVVTNSLGGMFFPMASSLQGSGEMERLKSIYIRAFRNLHMVSAAVTVAIILFADKILFYWLGSDYAIKGSKVLVVLAVTYFFVALYIPLQSLLLGLGKIKFLIRQSLVMGIINFILLILFVPKFGIMGAAWAYLIAVLPMLYGFYWTERQLFNINGQFKHYLRLYGQLLLTAAVDGVLIHFCLLPLANSIWTLVIVGPISVLLYFLLYFLFGFIAREDSDLIKAFIFKFLRIKS